MLSKSWLWVGLPVCLGASGLVFAAPASACSPSPCQSPVRLPPDPWLPGNHVYFPITAEQEPTDLALRTAAGEPIAASIRTIGTDRVFAPEQPIAEGTELVLDYTETCFDEPTPQTFEFAAAPQGEIELIPARLEIEERGVSGPGRDHEASFVRLRYSSGDTNGTAASLMTHTYTVDGASTWPRIIDGEELLEILVPCRPQLTSALVDSCGSLLSSAPGVHSVEVSTRVVGAVTQPEPVRLEVEVQCPAPDSGSGGLAAPPVASSDGGGCSLGRRSANGYGLLALGAAFALSQARRRSLRSAR